MQQQADRPRQGRPAAGEHRRKRKIVAGHPLIEVAEVIERRAADQGRSVSSVVTELLEREFAPTAA